MSEDITPVAEEATIAPEQSIEAAPEAAPEEIQEIDHTPSMASRSREASPPPDFVPSDNDSDLKDMMVKRLYEDMGMIVEDEKAKDEPVSEEAVAAKAEEVKPEPEKPRRKTTVQSKDEFAREFVESVRDVVRSERPVEDSRLPLPPEEELPVVSDTDGLIDEQKFELELMEHAQREMKDKYPDIRARSIQFYKDMDAWVAKQTEEDSDFSMENNSEEIEEYVSKNKPSLDPLDERRMERALIREQAVSQIRSESDAKFRDLENKTRTIEERPRIQSESSQFKDSLLDADGSEALALIKDGKMKEASEQFPMEASVANEVTERVSKIYEDYMYYDRGLASFEERRDSMEFLDKFLSEQGQFFAQNGGEARMREGRQFLPVAEYNQSMNQNAQQTQARHWTFDSADVRELLGASARQQIKTSISQMEEQISRYGFVRKPTESDPQRKDEVQVQAVTPPLAQVSAAPGSANPSGIPNPDHPGTSVIDALGIRGPFPETVE